ncbi:Lar family restriction alleviation protein [Nitratireductor basaltis]|uniref:Lar family restriction alleviation protein n=1 Tax=Nitratireductor basaltis TaxID=472175 RepID=UPI0009DD924E
MVSRTLPADGAKPCPFCGGADLHVETDSEADSTFQVVCDNDQCEAEGPNGARHPAEAVALWNQRY